MYRRTQSFQCRQKAFFSFCNVLFQRQGCTKRRCAYRVITVRKRKYSYINTTIFLLIEKEDVSPCIEMLKQVKLLFLLATSIFAASVPQVKDGYVIPVRVKVKTVYCTIVVLACTVRKQATINKYELFSI
jgi:hypothetical protein